MDHDEPRAADRYDPDAVNADDRLALPEHLDEQGMTALEQAQASEAGEGA